MSLRRTTVRVAIGVQLLAWLGWGAAIWQRWDHQWVYWLVFGGATLATSIARVVSRSSDSQPTDEVPAETWAAAREKEDSRPEG